MYLSALTLLAQPAWAEPPPGGWMLGMTEDGAPIPQLLAELNRIHAISFPEAPLPMGVWLTLGEGRFVYSYVDSEAGPSVAGELQMPPGEEPVPGDGTVAMHIIVRTGTLGGMTPLTEAERVAAGLPKEPAWLKNYGPQPPRGSEWGGWRSDPLLAGRFHPEYPDDLQVIIYAGKPPKIKGEPELVWVRVWSCDADTCEGRLLNEPFHIPSIHEGDRIRFGKYGKPEEYLVMVPGGAR